jgi:hypothetical protein
VETDTQRSIRMRSQVRPGVSDPGYNMRPVIRREVEGPQADFRRTVPTNVPTAWTGSKRSFDSLRSLRMTNYFAPVAIDSPRKLILPGDLKPQNEKLEIQDGIEEKGFPTVMVVNPDGKIMGEFTGYDREGPADIIARLEKWRS